MAAEVSRLESLLSERQFELKTLREEMFRFRARYAQLVGSLLAELAEVEQAIKDAETRILDEENKPASEGEGVGAKSDAASSEKLVRGNGLRKLFWSVAKLFHPDHAADETEARRRHQIMVEASRAYRDGDVESLYTLLGDQELQFYCVGVQTRDDPGDLNLRLLSLKEELRTVEFGIKRISQDALYRIKLASDEESRKGRDALSEEAKRIGRQIVKARHRLTNMCGSEY